MQEDKREGEGGRRKRKRVWVAAAIATLLAAVVCGLWLFGDWRSADERLAEIEARRAIPDSENAALIYDELLQDPRATSLSDSRPAVLDNGQLFHQRRSEPWLTEDGPELAAWIAEHQYIIDRLVAASLLESCRFPISIDLTDMSHVERAAPMRQWAFLLLFAINNDLAEGRLDEAVTKWRCIIQMGNHLRQQPVLTDHILASATTRWALKSMVRFVATVEPSARHLEGIEVMPLPLADDWQEHRDRIKEIDRLIERKMKEPFTFWDRLQYPIVSYRMKRVVKKAFPDRQESLTESTGNWYRQGIATARGLRILVALRRYHDATGSWPQSLEEISPPLPEPILTDPLNGGPFVYRLTGEAFELYSKGPNKIDETVRRRSDKGDDWPIWPVPQPKPKPKPKPRQTPVDREAQKKMMKQLKEIYGERFQIDKP